MRQSLRCLLRHRRYAERHGFHPSGIWCPRCGGWEAFGWPFVWWQRRKRRRRGLRR